MKFDTAVEVQIPYDTSWIFTIKPSSTGVWVTVGGGPMMGSVNLSVEDARKLARILFEAAEYKREDAA